MTEVGACPLVILAGGRGTRMGGIPKGMLRVGEGTLLSWQLDRFRAAGGGAAVVVLGHGAADYRAVVPEVAQAWKERRKLPSGLVLAVAVSDAPEAGPIASVVAGLRCAGEAWPEAGGCYVLPVDVPAPPPAVWADLAAALPGNDGAATPERDGRGGHPILLGRDLARRLAALDPWAPDARLDVVLRNLAPAARVRVVVAADEVVTNLNDAAALASWRARSKV